MSNLRLVVEVAGAYDLMPEDGQGSSNALVELKFGDQKLCTSVKENDLNPKWDETFFFNVSNASELHKCTLEAHVYSINNNSSSKSSLGKVQLSSTSFVEYLNAWVVKYPLLDRRHSRVIGEIGLKVYVTYGPDMVGMSDFHTSQELPSQKMNEPVLDAAHSWKEDPINVEEEPYIVPDNQSFMSGVGKMKFDRDLFQAFKMYGDQPSYHADFFSAGITLLEDDIGTVYDLLKPDFLFVRVVKARNLPSEDLTQSLNPYVEVRLGNYKGITRRSEKIQTPEWNAVFTFSKDKIKSSDLEVVVKDKDMIGHDFVGFIRFDPHEIPTRVPPDSPLVPQWYCLEDKKGEKRRGELMLAVWIGKQDDEAFSEAWHSDAATPVDSSVFSKHMRGRVYFTPRLWYVRVNVIEAHGLVMTEKNEQPNVHIKAQVGNQILMTKSVKAQMMNALWNEDLMFVAAEPFHDHVVITVEVHNGQNKDEALGKVFIPLTTVEKRIDDRIVPSRWFNLQKPSLADIEEPSEKLASRVRLRVCFDGGYNVQYGSTYYCSDLRPSAKELWKPPIGVLELAILNISNLSPMKERNGQGTSDTYCVAKYGQKWVRTRTIMGSLNPKFNEQYTWEVFDPCTVLTVGVFDNGQLGEIKSKGQIHKKIGKVRIRLSTLETDRIYTHAYPLLVLHPSGVKKMGELHLGIRFTWSSMVSMMSLSSKPLFPKMHYNIPLTKMQLEFLHRQAFNMVAATLNRADPPLKKEVVEYMCDADPHLWSLRRMKAHFFRILGVLSSLTAVLRWFDQVCMWKNPVTTMLVHALFIMFAFYPRWILPALFLYMFLIGLWNYRYRPRHPPHMNTNLSQADTAHLDELDEEFDTYPASGLASILRTRYDRLRSITSRVQTVALDIVSQGERVQALVTWQAPWATIIFLTFCVVAAIVMYAVPFRLFVVMTGVYCLRHPKFRHNRKLPSATLNFFWRLPTKNISLL